jgi:hypothetical protein
MSRQEGSLHEPLWREGARLKGGKKDFRNADHKQEHAKKKMIWWTETMRIHNSQGPEGTTALSTGCPWWLRFGWTSTKLLSLVTHCVRSMCNIFRWMGKKILVLGDSQMPTWFLTWFSARFSQREPVDIFTGEIGSENQPQVVTWMRTDHENQFYYIY